MTDYTDHDQSSAVQSENGTELPGSNILRLIDAKLAEAQQIVREMDEYMADYTKRLDAKLAEIDGLLAISEQEHKPEGKLEGKLEGKPEGKADDAHRGDHGDYAPQEGT